MDTQHNEDIIAMLQRAMSQHNRTEKLVVFDGTIEDESGVKRHMTYIEQFTLFRSATTVIGPHGTVSCSRFGLFSRSITSFNTIKNVATGNVECSLDGS